MIKTNHFVRNICFTTFVLIGLAAIPVNAQVKKDSTNKLLLAKLGKKEMPPIAIKEANVIYPDLLCGNEEQSLDYIENFSTNRRNYLIRTYNKGKTFFPKAVAILAKNNIPHEFKVLLALESAFNGNAVSRAGAVGYWQIMDEVAKEYGLKYARNMNAAQRRRELKLAQAIAKKQHKKFKSPVMRDDRKNFDKATYAAARYLRDRCRNLDNDYLLVVASYNCGVGNVWNAMEKTGKVNPTFWDVKNYLPSETRSYVMNFIALNVIFNNYEKFVNNTLCFKPITAKAGHMTEELDDPTSLNNQ